MTEADIKGLLSALGLCVKAGKTVFGTPMVCEALRRGGKNAPVLVLEASDTSSGTHKRLCDKCSFYGVKHIRLECTGEQLAHAVGKSATLAALAVTDAGMCSLIERYI